MDQENQNFEKMKKTPGDIIVLQMCTINDSYIMYTEVWSVMENFLCHFGLIFALLPS